MVDNPHKYHRKRLRKELVEQDFPESVPDHKVLEALLFYGISQKDTNPIAHDLINNFGSLTAVLEADADSLFQVKGMTERSVTLIKLMLPIFRRYTADRNANRRVFKSIKQICEYLVVRHQSYGREVFILTCLNESGNLICCDVISKGGALDVSFEIKDVVQKVLKHNASYVVISHNHLTGNLIPSREDIVATEQLNFTLKQMNIGLIDHVIVSGNEYLSLVEGKYIVPNV